MPVYPQADAHHVRLIQREPAVEGELPAIGGLADVARRHLKHVL